MFLSYLSLSLPNRPNSAKTGAVTFSSSFLAGGGDGAAAARALAGGRRGRRAVHGAVARNVRGAARRLEG